MTEKNTISSELVWEIVATYLTATLFWFRLSEYSSVFFAGHRLLDFSCLGMLQYKSMAIARDEYTRYFYSAFCNFVLYIYICICFKIDQRLTLVHTYVTYVTNVIDHTMILVTYNVDL